MGYVVCLISLLVNIDLRSQSQCTFFTYPFHSSEIFRLVKLEVVLSSELLSCGVCGALVHGNGW